MNTVMNTGTMKVLNAAAAKMLETKPPEEKGTLPIFAQYVKSAFDTELTKAVPAYKEDVKQQLQALGFPLV